MKSLAAFRFFLSCHPFSVLQVNRHHREVPGTRILGSSLSGNSLGLAPATAIGTAIEDVISASRTAAVMDVLESISVERNISGGLPPCASWTHLLDDRTMAYAVIQQVLFGATDWKVGCEDNGGDIAFPCFEFESHDLPYILNSAESSTLLTCSRAMLLRLKKLVSS